MMPKSVLQLRVQRRIKYFLQDMFVKSDILYKNKAVLITISDVDISNDLRNLKIFLDLTDLDISIKKEIVKRLNKENIYTIKKLLAEKINLKFVPEPMFILDDSSDKLFKINKIIEKDKNL